MFDPSSSICCSMIGYFMSSFGIDVECVHCAISKYTEVFLILLEVQDGREGSQEWTRCGSQNRHRGLIDWERCSPLPLKWSDDRYRLGSAVLPWSVLVPLHGGASSSLGSAEWRFGVRLIPGCGRFGDSAHRTARSSRHWVVTWQHHDEPRYRYHWCQVRRHQRKWRRVFHETHGWVWSAVALLSLRLIKSRLIRLLGLSPGCVSRGSLPPCAEAVVAGRRCIGRAAARKPAGNRSCAVLVASCVFQRERLHRWYSTAVVWQWSPLSWGRRFPTMWLKDRLVRSSPLGHRDLSGRLSEGACRIVHGQLHSEDRRCSGTQLLSSVPSSPVLSFVCRLGFVH